MGPGGAFGKKKIAGMLTVFTSGLAGFLVLAVLALPLTRNEKGHAVIYAGCSLLSGIMLWASLLWLFSPLSAGVQEMLLPFGLPGLRVHLRIDSLSAFFLGVLMLAAMVSSLFAVGYGAHAPNARRVTPLYPLFLFGMSGVLITSDAFSFMVCWEIMSLASWFLVVSSHDKAETRRAAFVYLVMAIFGGLCLILAFGLLGGASADFTFEAMAEAKLTPAASVLVILFTLLGTGSKAGIAPLHAWLPLAHPAAPSHVSALMSGAMTKIAIYAMIRLLFDLHGAIPWQWGAGLMLIGGMTAVIGILHAVVQDDLKRLLAYSTVDNIGIITIAIGLALVFKDKGQMLLAMLAMIAAFYHVLNHSLFKTLLFLGAGSVLAVTGERRLDQMGGLLNRMPKTGAAFLIGAVAISSFPPLNGFVSEWLIFQALFRGPTVPLWAMKFGVPVVGAMLALAAALAAACFVRAFGVAFLGRPRSDVARDAVETNWPMWGALMIPAALCVILGVFPVTVTGAIAGVVEPLIGVSLPTTAELGWPWLSPIDASQGSYSATVMMVCGLVFLGITVWVIHHVGARTTLRRAPIWDCGHLEENRASQYSAVSFAQPIRRVFRRLLMARERVSMPAPGDPSPAVLEIESRDLIWDYLYAPLGKLVGWLANQFNRLQTLSIQNNLMLGFALLITLLILVMVQR